MKKYITTLLISVGIAVTLYSTLSGITECGAADGRAWSCDPIYFHPYAFMFSLGLGFVAVAFGINLE